MKKLDYFKKCFALVLFLALFSATVQAMTPVESSIESRLYLTFQVQESALQGLLPEPWQVNAISTGPSKGGNLTVIFVQALVCETPEGKPAPSGGTARYVVLTVPAKNALTGEESVFFTRIYTTDSERVPGHYKNAVKANILHEYSVKTEESALGQGKEDWKMKITDGSSIKVRFEYKQTALNHVQWERKIRTIADPDLSFIYRVDQTGELLKSEALGVDRLTLYNFSSTVPEHNKYLNNRAKLVSVTKIPNFMVQVSQP